MSMWELAACIDGYRRANGGEETVSAPSASEFEDMITRLG